MVKQSQGHGEITRPHWDKDEGKKWFLMEIKGLISHHLLFLTLMFKNSADGKIRGIYADY